MRARAGGTAAAKSCGVATAKLGSAESPWGAPDLWAAAPSCCLAFSHGGKEMKLQGEIAGAGAGTIPSPGQVCSITPRKQRCVCALISAALAPHHWLSLGHGGSAVTQLRDLAHLNACPVQRTNGSSRPSAGQQGLLGATDCFLFEKQMHLTHP